MTGRAGGSTTESQRDSRTGGIGTGKSLTARQAEVLRLVADGLSDKEIAARLHLSMATVRSHLQRTYREYNFRNRANAAAAWVTYRGRPEPVEPAQRPVVAGLALMPPPRMRRPRALRVGVLAALVGMVALLGLLVRPGVLLHPGSQAMAGRLATSPLPASMATHSSAKPAAAALAKATASQPGIAATGSVSATSSAPSQAVPAVIPSARALIPSTPPQIPAPVIKVQAATAQLALVNQDRAAALLPAMQWNGCLASAAAQVAQGLAQGGGLGVTRGLSLDLRCGLGPAPGENAGSWPGIDDAQMNTVFMADPLERSRILGTYHYMGAAWARSSAGVAVLVVEFS